MSLLVLDDVVMMCLRLLKGPAAAQVELLQALKNVVGTGAYPRNKRLLLLTIMLCRPGLVACHALEG